MVDGLSMDIEGLIVVNSLNGSTWPRSGRRHNMDVEDLIVVDGST